MIGENETLGGFHRRHVARSAGHLYLDVVAGRGMTRGAGLIISREPGFQRTVRRVATDAAQFALAGSEATAGGQQ